MFTSATISWRPSNDFLELAVWCVGRREAPRSKRPSRAFGTDTTRCAEHGPGWQQRRSTKPETGEPHDGCNTPDGAGGEHEEGSRAKEEVSERMRRRRPGREKPRPGVNPSIVITGVSAQWVQGHLGHQDLGRRPLGQLRQAHLGPDRRGHHDLRPTSSGSAGRHQPPRYRSL